MLINTFCCSPVDVVRKVTWVEVSCPPPKSDPKLYTRSVAARVAAAELTKKVAPGDELVLYIPATQKKEAGKFLELVASPTKRSRKDDGC